jgi:hypothetical protein
MNVIIGYWRNKKKTPLVLCNENLMYMYVVKPVLRGHICDKEIVAL